VKTKTKHHITWIRNLLFHRRAIRAGREVMDGLEQALGSQPEALTTAA
jgi:hypothetical protein